MMRTETVRRYGRTAVNQAELPASPAAATNGSSGKQQLEAATALANAAVLATIVPGPPGSLLVVMAVLYARGDFTNGIPDEGNARRVLGTASDTVRAATHTRIAA